MSFNVHLSALKDVIKLKTSEIRYIIKGQHNTWGVPSRMMVIDES